MSLSAAALTTVAAVQDVIGTSAATARIERAIESVSRTMARYCGITFEYGSNITEWHVGEATRKLYLRRRAIASVASVYVMGTAQTIDVLDSSLTPDQVVSETVYRSDEWDAEGILYRPCGWPLCHAVWGDLTHQPAIGPDQRQMNLRVVYTGGYVTPQQNVDGVGARTLPYDLEDAVIREVADRVSRPIGSLVSERTPGGWSQTWAAGSGGDGIVFAADTMRVLADYRRDWL